MTFVGMPFMRCTMLALLFCVGCGGGGVAAVAAVVDAEPNNTFGQAQSLGLIRPGDVRTITGSVRISGDLDRFEFFTDESVEVSATLKWVSYCFLSCGSWPDFRLSFLDAGNQLVAQGGPRGTPSGPWTIGAPRTTFPGTSRFQVLVEPWGTDAGAYTLTVSANVAPPPLPQGPTLFAVDLTTGHRTVVSDSTVGIGPDFSRPVAVALDASSDRALVLDAGLSAVFAVALQTGDREILSGPFSPGAGFVGATDLAYDAGRNSVVVADPQARALLRIDLDTSAQSVLASDLGARAVAFDRVNDRYLVIGAAGTRSVLFAVDAATGVRNQVVSALGPLAQGVAVNAAGSQALVADPGDLIFPFSGGGPLRFSPDILLVDVATGIQTKLAGVGPRLEFPLGVEFDEAENRAIVLDGIGWTPSSRPGFALFAVRLDSGDRTILTELSSANLAFGRANGLALDLARNRALVIAR